jgi:hypothetical protein
LRYTTFPRAQPTSSSRWTDVSLAFWRVRPEGCSTDASRKIICTGAQNLKPARIWWLHGLISRTRISWQAGISTTKGDGTKKISKQGSSTNFHIHQWKPFPSQYSFRDNPYALVRIMIVSVNFVRLRDTVPFSGTVSGKHVDDPFIYLFKHFIKILRFDNTWTVF